MNAARSPESRKLRIVHVFRAPLGGLFRHVVDLAAEQVTRGHDVGLFYDSEFRGDNVAAALARIKDGLRLGVAGYPIKRNPHVSDFPAIAQLTSNLRRLEPDIVHGHGSKGGLYARLPGFLPGGQRPARAYTPHGGSFNYQPGSALHRLYMTTERLLSLTTDVFLFESAYIADRYAAYVGGKRGLRRIVPNGIGAAEFEPVVPMADAADLLYVGELRAAKGIDTLLDAVALAGARLGEPPRTVLVGSGPDKEMLLARARRLGIAEKISFVGPMPAREAFRLGRLLVAPSRAESLPYIILEAAAARLPIVATNVGGIPEIFGPYAHRLGPCDDPANLCARILSAMTLSEDDRLAQTAELAAFVAANFSIKTMVDSVMDGYRAALAQRAPRRTAETADKLHSTTRSAL
jgi:glycosyltransferase involved in cell wall biosynthesis